MPEPGHRELEPGLLDLELGFVGTRLLREDIEDQLGPRDDADLEFLFEVADLRRRELVVEDDERGLGRDDRVADLGDLAAPDPGGRDRRMARLDDPLDDRNAERIGQIGEFLKMIVDIITGEFGKMKTDGDGPGKGRAIIRRQVRSRPRAAGRRSWSAGSWRSRA
jgi:hypothetical protein